jgi:hypothetical protein
MSADEEPPEFQSGGLVLGPGGEDGVPVWFDPRCEIILTAEQVKRMAPGLEAKQPGEREAG